MRLYVMLLLFLLLFAGLMVLLVCGVAVCWFASNISVYIVRMNMFLPEPQSDDNVVVVVFVAVSDDTTP